MEKYSEIFINFLQIIRNIRNDLIDDNPIDAAYTLGRFYEIVQYLIDEESIAEEESLNEENDTE